MLDTAEYIHLAMHASRKGDNHAALGYLKEALGQEPGNAVARYLLAAEHAEIGLYDRAIAGMQEALRLAPELEIAAFQLGLLQLQTNQPEAALRTFADLAARAQDPALQSFAHAYQHMIGEEREPAMARLREGLACCDNEHLKGDMQRVLDRISAGDTTAATTPAPAAQPVGSAFILGAYRDNIDAS